MALVTTTTALYFWRKSTDLTTKRSIAGQSRGTCAQGQRAEVGHGPFFGGERTHPHVVLVAARSLT